MPRRDGSENPGFECPVLRCVTEPFRTRRVTGGIDDESPFTVLSFPDREDPDIGYVWHAFGAVHMEQEAGVSAARLRFRHLARLALAPEDSREFVARVAAQP